jgi:Peptidase family M23
MAAPKRFRKKAIFWPVPEIPPRVPDAGEPGSFRENRGDRTHCGVDLYAPHGSIVVAAEGGTVAGTGIATSPKIRPYWNLTRSVTIASGGRRVWRYGELAAVLVREGDRVSGGQVIGTVGRVLNCGKVGTGSPPYIRDLCRRGATSMLHLELADRFLPEGKDCLGGNWFGRAGRLFPFRNPSPLLRMLK